MQITNNYQPSFKAAIITKKANELLSQRMASGEFVAFQEKFEKKFKDSKFKVTLDIVNKYSGHLDATISYNSGKKNPHHDEFCDYIVEGTLASIFCSPERFLEKIISLYQKRAIPFEKNGYKYM